MQPPIPAAGTVNMSANVAVAAEAAAAETQPLTAAGTAAVQAAKLSLLSGMLSKLKENAAISFKEVRAAGIWLGALGWALQWIRPLTPQR